MPWFNYLFCLAVPFTLTACQRQQPAGPAATSHVHFVRENVWLANGKYFYPQEMTQLDQTGLATVAAEDHAALTTDGEIFDPTSLAAAHQTLQLPAIVNVTNLANGLRINVRVNDRGPTDPGRVIELTPRAAELLQIPQGSVAQVRVVLLPGPTQALADQLHGGGLRIAMNLAPVGSVTSESLAPPPGSRSISRGIASDAPENPDQAPPESTETVPDRLPEQVTQTAPNPGRLYIRVDDFARADYAMREAAILAPYGNIIRQINAGEERFFVRGGPYPTVANADAALKTALRLGLRGARIVVE